ncbi:MAG: cytochrome P450 [Bacteriovoracaceae bacterium]
MRDQTLSFLKNPYGFFSEEAKKRKSKVFETRLLLRKTICMTGAEAAAIFYNPDYFMRKKAAPSPIKATLFGQGGLQGLDGVAHRRRKEMHMHILSPDRVKELGIMTREILRLQSVAWSLRTEISFYEESKKVLTEAVCRWAGIPLEDENIDERTQDLVAQYERAGEPGIGHFISRARRSRAEEWIGSLIRDVREGRLIPERDSVLGIVSSFKDHRSQYLSEHDAAVEVLNILRPAVAVSVYMTFIAHALSLFPEERPVLMEETSLHNFLQEVRRYYPFFPAIPARVKKSFVWKGKRFPRGERVMLDVFGTNHDSLHWTIPEDFYPDRFKNSDLLPFAFIPQGGGDVTKGHRCPGEEATMEIMKQTLQFLMEDMDYTVPAQDLDIDFSRMPALPKSHFKMSVVRLRYLQLPHLRNIGEQSFPFSHQ